MTQPIFIPERAIPGERVFIGLGTNLGDDLERNLRNALASGSCLTVR